MAKSLYGSFVSKEKGERTESQTDALLILYNELLRTLISKNVLSDEEVGEIFTNAFEQASPRQQERIQSIYDYFLGPPDSDDEGELEDEAADSENES